MTALWAWALRASLGASGVAADSCPWDGLRQLTGLPNVDWCEAEVCGWAVEPANTWSNAAYFVAAAYLARQRGRQPPGLPLLRWFPELVALLGAASLIYHASTNFLLQLGDFLGMFGVLGVLLAANAVRLGLVGPRAAPRLYAGLVVVPMGALFALRALDEPYQLLIAAGVVLLLVTEVAAHRRHPGSRLRGLGAAIALLAVAAAFSAADLARIYCDPQDHVLQGHAVWHVLSAAALAMAYGHYAALGAPRSGSRAP